MVYIKRSSLSIFVKTCVVGEPQVFRVAAVNKNGTGEFTEVTPYQVLKGTGGLLLILPLQCDGVAVSSEKSSLCMTLLLNIVKFCLCVIEFV